MKNKWTKVFFVLAFLFCYLWFATPISSRLVVVFPILALACLASACIFIVADRKFKQ